MPPIPKLSLPSRHGWQAFSHVATALLGVALTAGCGTFGAGVEEKAPGEVTPDTHGVYIDNSSLHVRLEPRSEASAPANDHPVQLTGKQVKAWLARIKVRPEDSGQLVSLIPSTQRTELSIIIAQALGDARPNEDVVFHSFRSAGSWFGSHRRVTTARVFYRDGALNLIFGDLDDFYSERIDYELQPLEPGYRAMRSELSGEVVDTPQVAFVDGRKDWIRLDTAPLAAAESARPLEVVSSPAPPVAASQPRQAPRDPRWMQLEERLLILDGLRRKGLITTEDYEAKKQDLLEVLDL
jgi:hypothetical protein